MNGGFRPPLCTYRLNWAKNTSWGCCRVVLSEAVDGCICFTRKIQHGGHRERSLSWACGHGTEMWLILKNPIFDLITPRYFPIWQSKEMSHDFVRGKSVAETCFGQWSYWGWWNESDDTALRTRALKFGHWWSEAEDATHRSWMHSTILNIYERERKKHLVSLKHEGQSGAISDFPSRQL